MTTEELAREWLEMLEAGGCGNVLSDLTALLDQVAKAAALVATEICTAEERKRCADIADRKIKENAPACNLEAMDTAAEIRDLILADHARCLDDHAETAKQGLRLITQARADERKRCIVAAERETCGAKLCGHGACSGIRSAVRRIEAGE